MTQPRRRPSTHGSTLVEMIVFILLIGITLGLATLTLNAGLRLGRAHEERRTQAAAWHRLGRAIRADVHGAQALSLEPGEPRGSRIEIVAADGGHVVYQVNALYVERREQPTIESHDTPRPRREVFPLFADGHAGRAEFRLEPVLLMLTIVEAGSPTAAAREGQRSWLAGEALVAALPPALAAAPALESRATSEEGEP